MRFIVEDDVKAVATRAAKYIAERINEFNPTPQRPFVLGLPVGDTVLPTYKELVALHAAGKVSFKHVVTFNMDTYCELALDSPSSHHSFMWRHFFGHIDICRENVHILNGTAADLTEECREYESKIHAFGGIELFFGHVGSDGHVAFNEPGSSLNSRTRVKTLSRATIVRKRKYFDNDTAKVPSRALTVGVKTFMESREVLFILAGIHSAGALREVIEGTVCHLCTASALQKHPSSVLIVDEDATSSLNVKTVKYFKGLVPSDGLDPHVRPSDRREAVDAVMTPRGDVQAPFRLTGKTVKLTNVKLVREGALVEEDLWFRDGKIIDAERVFWTSAHADECQADEVRDGCGAIVVPGFVELQLNGAFGIDFTDPDLKEEDVQKVAHGILAHGVTSFLPTVITAKPELYKAVLPKLTPGSTAGKGADILGVHCEGPFLSWKKKGTHPEECIQKAGFPKGISSAYDIYGEENIANRTVRLVTVAPELDGAMQAIADLTSAGITVSIGHTEAGIEIAEAAVRNGARKITHLFNAMQPFHHRDPGPVGLLGAQLPCHGEKLAHGAFYGIIADGLHVHPSAVNMAYRTHFEGCVLVTDSMAALGLGRGTHSIGGVEVIVEKAPAWGRGNVLRATKAGTDTLAGAVVDMHTCFKNFMAFTGCDVVRASACASAHPASTIGAEHKGRLDPGCDADFLLLHPETLDLQQTWVGGRRLWCEERTQLRKMESIFLDWTPFEEEPQRQRAKTGFVLQG